MPFTVWPVSNYKRPIWLISHWTKILHSWIWTFVNTNHPMKVLQEKSTCLEKRQLNIYQ